MSEAVPDQLVGFDPSRAEPTLGLANAFERADDIEPIGEVGAIDVDQLPDLLEPDQELDLRGRTGVRLFLRAVLRWSILGASVGIVAGCGASLFIVGLTWIVSAVDHGRASLPWWSIAAFPAIGGLVVGYLLWRADRVAFVSACGTDSFIDAVEEADGRIRARVPLLRILGAWLTIGFGGSSGRECPMIYTGAGLGSTAGQVLERVRSRLPRRLARLLDLDAADTRMLALCGAAGALGAVFSAPFGGAVFAVEVPYRRDVDMDLLVPALVSSSVGYLTGLLLVGRQRLLVGAIAVAASLAARGFAGIFNGFHHLVRTRVREDGRFPKWLQTGLGGLLAGVVMLAFPQVYGIGLDAIRGMASGREFAGHAVAITALLLAALGLAKMLASTFTVSTGGVGGLLFPSLFAGAAVGGSLATLAAHQWPGTFPHHAAYVLIAMSATYAAAGKVPIASLLLLCEACVNFSLALPMAVANLLAYLLSGRSTVYDVQRERSEMPHRGYRWAVALAVLVVLFGRFVVAV